MWPSATLLSVGLGAPGARWWQDRTGEARDMERQFGDRPLAPVAGVVVAGGAGCGVAAGDQDLRVPARGGGSLGLRVGDVRSRPLERRRRAVSRRTWRRGARLLG